MTLFEQFLQVKAQFEKVGGKVYTYKKRRTFFKDKEHLVFDWHGSTIDHSIDTYTIPSIQNIMINWMRSKIKEVNK